MLGSVEYILREKQGFLKGHIDQSCSGVLVQSKVHRRLHSRGPVCAHSKGNPEGFRVTKKPPHTWQTPKHLGTICQLLNPAHVMNCSA